MLERLGWGALWQTARAVADATLALEPVRVAAEHRGAYHAVGEGGVAWVELTGRAFHRAADKRELPTVGDWLLVERWQQAIGGNGAAIIRHVLPRRSLLVRRAAGEATAPQPLAANVDIAIVMTSANGDLSPARLDRYLGLVRDAGIAPVLVLSKVDLVADPAAGIAALRAVGGDAPVIAASTVIGTGIAEVRAFAGAGKTAVLLGSSGVGKSSLLNAVAATAQEIQPIRDDDRGQHTTTRRELFVTADGLWIDTPGMRELAQWIDEGGTPEIFDDIAELAAGCRFRDCKHRDEPGCAVRGHVAADRLANFHKLAGEQVVAVANQHAARRIAETRKAKAKRYPKSRKQP